MTLYRLIAKPDAGPFESALAAVLFALANKLPTAWEPVP